MIFRIFIISIIIIIVLILIIYMIMKNFKTEQKYNNIKRELDNQNFKISNDKIALNMRLEEAYNLKRNYEKRIIELENEYIEKSNFLDRKIEENNNITIKNKNQLIYKLEQLSFLSREEVTEQLKEELKSTFDSYYIREIKNHEQEIKFRKNEISQNILIDAMLNIDLDIIGDKTLVNVKLKEDKLKGKLIGKDGRNFKLLESLLGVTIIIDETPCEIFISSFNPIRRNIAKNALEKIVDGGIINQIVIEKEIEIATEHIEQNAYQLGRDAISTNNIYDMDENLVQHLGMLYYRNSLSQNVLEHSLEVASICKTIAYKLELDENLAARCGLLHDIGKMDETGASKNHVDYGVELATMYGENETVINAIAAHHDDVKALTVYAEIVKIADKLSASRPGARVENYDDHIKRIINLEKIANDFNEVNTSYALRGGKELRVIVNCEHIEDKELEVLAAKIKLKIEEENDFPGSVNIILIRETRYKTQTKI